MVSEQGATPHRHYSCQTIARGGVATGLRRAGGGGFLSFYCFISPRVTPPSTLRPRTSSIIITFFSLAVGTTAFFFPSHESLGWGEHWALYYIYIDAPNGDGASV